VPRVSLVAHSDWTSAPAPAVLATAAAALEAGDVLFLPDLAFRLNPSERPLVSPSIIAAGTKNISFTPSSRRVSGMALDGAEASAVRDMLDRFSTLAAALAGHLFPPYATRIERGRASFRPVEIAGRQSSWRKDDTRLHIDSFPSSPVQGRRILRVFTNVNPDGRARVWRIGDDFEQVARRFAGRLRLPLPGTAALLRLLHITHSRRSPYDALMTQLHDHMKGDAEFQAESPQLTYEFPAGTTWVAFTDQVSHAAMSGQHQLEQTFLLPVEAMLDERQSPLRILEGLKGRPLS
jgi:hypothetical protein